MGAWMIWGLKNDVVFKGARVYVENTWELTVLFLQDWAQELVDMQGVFLHGGAIKIAT
ncbi:hypothetical protein QJS04_geneDACA004529 [Acorus gramineus]|uniref:Uncharacterized protein n=1 Tax=Acorus gramineus TaxID=55184 RepID=A0AAV9BTS3_ACOGR|nr:hypothetical protein QJS04_geneDACA004529 [Acorus gramineus]